MVTPTLQPRPQSGDARTAAERGPGVGRALQLIGQSGRALVRCSQYGRLPGSGCPGDPELLVAADTAESAR